MAAEDKTRPSPIPYGYRYPATGQSQSLWCPSPSCARNRNSRPASVPSLGERVIARDGRRRRLLRLPFIVASAG
jgi:hypothetical protein